MADQHDAIQNEQNYVVQTYARPDFVLTRAEGTTVYDEHGKAYQDWVGGIAVNALGYNDPGVNEVIQSQLATGIMHVSNLYHSEPHANLAKLLVESSFADRVFFCNSGTEANEAAMKFARRLAYNSGATEKKEIVCFTGGFHGRTMGSLAVTPREKYQAPFRPLMQGAVVAEFNNIESAQAAITDKTAAVIVEPVQGEGGVHPATDEFLQAVRKSCDEHGAMLIFDEVQCGLGRTGTLWAYEQYSVVPDMVTLAKPLAVGLPIGAVLVTEQVASAMHPGDHGSTFAGGPLVTRVATHVVERIREADFLQNVQTVGAYLLDRLSEINSPLIKEVRGRGLIAAVECSEPVTPLIQAGYEQGLLLVNAGPNVLRFIPPLVVQNTDVDQLADKLTTIFANV